MPTSILLFETTNFRKLKTCQNTCARVFQIADLVSCIIRGSVREFQLARGNRAFFRLGPPPPPPPPFGPSTDYRGSETALSDRR